MAHPLMLRLNYQQTRTMKKLTFFLLQSCKKICSSLTLTLSSCSMWEIYTRDKPWDHVNHAWQISDMVVQGERPKLPPDCPLAPLINKCWALDPDSRPNFSDIYSELET